MKRFLLVWMLVSGLMVAGRANAVLTITLTESGSDVIGSTSGSVDTTGATCSSGDATVAQLQGSGAALVVGTIPSSPPRGFRCNVSVAGPTSFGAGTSAVPATSATGDRGGVYGAGSPGVIPPVPPLVYLPTQYVSGTAIIGSATWTGSSISSLCLTPGTYTYTLPNDTVTVVINGSAPAAAPAAIPTLSEWAMILMASLMGLFAFTRFRRQS